MVNEQKVKWPGLSGKEYEYWVYPIGATFKKEPGNYIFAKVTPDNKWAPCYIGQTEDLDARLGNHEKEACAKRHGATYIHAHLTAGGESVRKAEERDLSQLWKPPCNEQLK